MGARLIIFEDGNHTVSIPSLERGQNGIRNLEVVGSNPTLGTSVNWDAFFEWLCKDKKERVARDIIRYAKQYHHCLTSMDLSEIAAFPDAKRRLILASLSNLAKYMGIYDTWKATVHRYGLKWISTETRDKRIIDRLTRKSDPLIVYNWVKQVKREHPEYDAFMELIAITGMRLEEAIASYNLIISLSKQGKLNEYYNEDKEVLEHYKFKELFLRKGKKAFISFVPKQLIAKITLWNHLMKSKDSIKKHIGICRFSDLREAHASILTKHLNQNEIDFLHGRIGTTVFMQNYFNPALISDLKGRVFKAIEEIRAYLNV